jgi:glutathione S-transferase
MLIIWGRINSHNVKKVVWAAHECGLVFERRDMGGVRLHAGIPRRTPTAWSR